MTRRLVSLQLRLQRGLREERGDIPGWVLVTLMTALLVALIYGLASTQLQALFNRAMSSI